EPANRSRYKMLAKVYRAAGIKPLRSRVAPIMLARQNLSAPWVDEWLARLERNDRAGLVKAIESVADRDPCEAEAGRIIAPTLVVVGGEDAASPPAKPRPLPELIDNTTLHELPGAGPSTPMEQPTRVTAVLEAVPPEHNG